LAGEGLEQFNLSLGERANFGASDDNHANGITRADQRDGQICAQAEASSNIATLWVFISFGLQIVDLDRLPIEDGTPRENATRQGQRSGRRNRPMVGHQGEHVTLHLMDCRIIGIAKPSRARRHHLLPALQKGA
jgi:hypothetical protein